MKIRGRVTVHPRGFGFVVGEADGRIGETSAFVAPPDLNGFLDGDVVDADAISGEDGRTSARALVLVERTRRELFGTVVTRHGKPFLHIDRLVSNTDWPFVEGEKVSDGGAVVGVIDGDRVRVERVVEADADHGLERVLARHGVRSTWPAAIARSVAKAPPIGAERRDLRAIPTVTIDAPVTRDLDDALAVLPAGADGALRVLVSIADVGAFVEEGTPLDEEARLRGTSVYLAGRVVPMLPEEISNGAASLEQDRDRPALTAELRVDAEGAITSTDIYESVIKSHARLTYDAVAEYLAEGSSKDVSKNVEVTLRWLRTAAARLSAVRAARGGVELAREEAYVSLDTETREPLAVEPRADTPAHRLVERLMVAANEAVAGWLVARGLPGLYRVHDEPTPDRVAMLASFAHNFGFESGFGPRLSPRALAAFEEQFAASRTAPAIRTVLGKMLGPARYSVEPSQHFGLGAPLYLHFTSPIRRYADLAVHRVVKSFLHGRRVFDETKDELATLAQHLNHVSRGAAKAETERHRMLVARLYASKIGAEVQGNVVSVKPFGLVVQLAGTGVTGTIAIDALPGGPYAVDLATQSLASGARRYSLGDPIRAVVASTNEELGRIDLKPIG